MSTATTTLYATGVLICFSIAAVFNERAYSSKDFYYPWTTVTLEFSFYCLMSFLRHQCSSHNSTLTTTTTTNINPPSPWIYILTGTLKVLGHGLPLMSLTLSSQPVDYVTYTLIKSSKVVVAAFVNRVFYGKSPAGEVTGSIVVTFGLILWNHDTLLSSSSGNSGNIGNMDATGTGDGGFFGGSQHLGVVLLLLGSLIASINRYILECFGHHQIFILVNLTYITFSFWTLFLFFTNTVSFNITF